MKTSTITFSMAVLLLIPLIGHADGPEQNEDPGAYIEFYKDFDGRCQGLRRGDIRLMRNVHPDKAIKYRLVRLLGGRRTVSLIQGTIEPREEGQRLGCEILEGREQIWQLVRAEFIPASPEKDDGNGDGSDQ